MHYAYLIAKGLLSPAAVPALEGVAIDWTHRGDLEAARAAAKEMVAAYGIVYAPALSSRHTQGLAIDMDVSWMEVLTVARPEGAGSAVIGSLPRSDANRELHQIGAEYGVYKLLSDPPHWSADGH
ncbi:MAG TPA: hypothetical protein VHD76_22640 [Bryobacteraceae bacterium]|jgi:hypothetical protein|nr:hypothetical protein [Bryobacteraceae bacterium]